MAKLKTRTNQPVVDSEGLLEHIAQNGNTTEIGGNLEVDGDLVVNGNDTKIGGDLEVDGDLVVNGTGVGTKLYLHTITVNDTIIEVISSSSEQSLPQGTVLNAYVKCVGGAPSKQGYIYWNTGTAVTSFATIDGTVDFYIKNPAGAQWTEWEIDPIN